MTTKQAFPHRQSTALHDGFLVIMPRIQVHAQISFRKLRCSQTRADSVQETVALAFRWYTGLIGRSKDPAMFPATFASFAVRAVRNGRRVCGQEAAKDVLSGEAQRKHGFRVEYLATSTGRSHDRIYSTVRGQQLMDAYEERLRDNTQTPVFEQVCFRMDWPEWLLTRTDRDRNIIANMAQNARTMDLAQKFGISPARISQLRREYQQDWTRFCEDLQSDPN